MTTFNLRTLCLLTICGLAGCGLEYQPSDPPVVQGAARAVGRTVLNGNSRPGVSVRAYQGSVLVAEGTSDQRGVYSVVLPGQGLYAMQAEQRYPNGRLTSAPLVVQATKSVTVVPRISLQREDRRGRR